MIEEEIIYGIIGGSGFVIAILAIGGAWFRGYYGASRFRDVPPLTDQGRADVRGRSEGERGYDR